MGRRSGPKKVHRYSMAFKLTAVKLSGSRACRDRRSSQLHLESTPSAARWRTRCATGCEGTRRGESKV